MTEQRDFPAWKAHLETTHLRPPGERAPIGGQGVHHLALICSDVERTIAFHQELLGFPLVEVMENRDYPGSTHFFMDIGNGNLLAFFDFPGLGLEPGVEALGGVQHVAISVTEEHWNAARERLDAAGITYHGPGPGMETSIYVKDPDGIQIELLAEPLRQMMNKPIGGAA
jgi:glyoxylase I family protein